MPRFAKQFIVLVIFLIIVGGLGFGIYRVSFPPTPTPTPNPTINLAPLRVTTTKLLNVQNNDYDFIAKVYDSNSDYGSGNVGYELKFYDVNNTSFSTKTGSFYILPGQTRYVIDTPIHLDRQVTRADFQIKTVDWQKIDTLSKNGIDLVAKNVSFVSINQGGTYAKAGGDVVNTTDFDFDSVDVGVVALDSSNQIVAVNKTIIKTFLSKTNRGFEVTWFSPFVGGVDHVDAEAVTNVFNNLNFIRQYGGNEHFQRRY